MEEVGGGRMWGLRLGMGQRAEMFRLSLHFWLRWRAAVSVAVKDQLFHALVLQYLPQRALYHQSECTFAPPSYASAWASIWVSEKIHFVYL